MNRTQKISLPNKPPSLRSSFVPVELHSVVHTCTLKYKLHIEQQRYLPLSEGSAIDLDYAVFHKGFGSDQFVVTGIVHDIQYTCFP